MAWYRPAKRTDGRWDYVCTNGAGTFPLGYCGGYRELKDDGVLKGMFSQAMLDLENARTEPFKAKYHTDGHATEAEASNCYREHQLDQVLKFDDGANAREQHRCGICNEWTGGYAYIRGGYQIWHLCAAHRNRESVEKLWPKQAED